MISGSKRRQVVLGLDLGSESIGWCLLEADGGKPAGLIDAGVRVFPAGMEGAIEAGKGESRATVRREARAVRRQTDRRRRRKRKLLHILQRAGLLPEGEARDVLPALDKELLADALDGRDADDPLVARLPHVLPYWLRAQGLDRTLTRYQLGRALYHLGQRRGFRSNRKADRKDDDESVVREGIAQLWGDIDKAGCRTLGEFFAQLDPTEQRIRARYTHRDMFRREFDQLWEAQKAHHPDRLTDELRETIRDAIFYQRPLKSAKGLVGTCPLERGKKRLALADPLAQRRRILQQINDCRVITPDGELRPLTDEERKRLADALQREGDKTFARAKKLLGLPRGTKFAIEEGGEKRFAGHRTNQKMAKVFGERWWEMSDAERGQAIEDVRSFQNAAALRRRGRRRWKLDAAAAKALAETQLEEGYARLSRRATKKLLGHMEAGMSHAEAVKKVYGQEPNQVPVHDELPPLQTQRKLMPELTNPVVHRVLTELRKVVNGLIRQWGKPDLIRIELARDLRQSRRQRQEATSRNRSNERERDRAEEQIREVAGIARPSRDDILKYRLAQECRWECPYTGEAITMAGLFGSDGQFDIEHIIPFSRSLDDSFLNKTLCWAEENRNRKRNRTPHEAYASDPARWEEILERVKGFAGDAARVKLRRFQRAELPTGGEFVDSQLNDTRYASRLAGRYLAHLYGGLWDAEGVRRIQATRGAVTAYVREAFELNSLLNDGPGKTRDDHRHHAVDALAVALTGPALVGELSRAAYEAYQRTGRRRRFDTLPAPFPDFHERVREVIGGIVVSHRPVRKVNGRLHKETNYGRFETPGEKGPAVQHRVRKPLANLTATDVERIVDDRVRALVKARLEEIGKPPGKAFEDVRNHPTLPGRNGPVPIHKVRVNVGANPRPIGDPEQPRHVVSDTNHHLEVVAVLDEEGNEIKWEGVLVSRLEAVRRLRDHQPVVRRDHGANRRFKFSLASRDMLRLSQAEKEPELVVVRSVWVEQRGQARIRFADIRDSREVAQMAKSLPKPGVERLRKLGAQKVKVTPTGGMQDAND